ncbi:MAG TPA: hypothetical protein PKW72_08995 [Treponemataceae bacterium]|nr:hypothetical protein [Treponemataceae bacterium]
MEDVFSDKNIGQIFGFEKPEEPLPEEYAGISPPGNVYAYEAAKDTYENVLLPEYEAKIVLYRAVSLNTLFSADPGVLKDFGSLAEFRGNCTDKIRQKYEAVIGESLARGEYEQAWFWFADMYLPSTDSAERQYAELEKTYGVIVYDSPVVPANGFADNHAIRGPVDALNAYGWETVCLDGYQMELVKARSVETYWEKEVAVAQAVWEYAVNETHSREGAAETLENNRNALEAYNRVLGEYRDAVAELSAVTDAITERNADIALCREKIVKKQAELEKVKNEISRLLIMAKLDTAEFYVGRFRTCYEDLLRERGLLPGEEPTWSPETLGSTAAAAQSDSWLSRTSSSLELLVYGNPQGTWNEIPLETLRALVEQLRVYVPEDDLPAALAGDPGTYLENKLGLWRDDPWHAVLCSAWEQWLKDNDSETLRGSFLDAGVQLLARAEGALAQRELLIQNLLSRDSEGLYSAIRVFCDSTSSPDSPAAAVKELKLAEDTAERLLLRERLDYEGEILDVLGTAIGQYIEEHGVESGNGTLFDPSGLFSGDAGKQRAAELLVAIFRRNGCTDDNLKVRITALAGSLDALQALLSSAPGTTLDDAETVLHELAENDSVVASYLAGGTVFYGCGVDWIAGNLSSYSRFMRYSGVSSVFSSFAASAPALYEFYQEEWLTGLGNWLAANSLGQYSEQTISLADPEAIWIGPLSGMSVDTVFSTLARLDRELQDLLATESMPGNTGVLVGRWFEAVADFALSRVVCTEGGVPLSDEVLQASKAEVDSLGEALRNNPADADVLASFNDTSAQYRYMLLFNRITEETAKNFRLFLSAENSAKLLYDPEEGESPDGGWDSTYGPSAVVYDLAGEREGSLINGSSAVLNTALEYAATARQFITALNGVFRNLKPVTKEARDEFIDKNIHIGNGSTEGIFLHDSRESGRDFEREVARLLESLSNQHMLAENLYEYGSQVRAFQESGDTAQNELTGAMKATMQILEEELAGLEQEWAEYLGVGSPSGEVPPPSQYATASYAALERAYASQYERSRNLFTSVENAKLEYRKARAIHDYASTPYLDAHEGDPDVFILALTSGAVHPDTLLAEASERQLRAECVREALEASYAEGTPQGIYGNDPRYRDYRTAYETRFLYLLAAKQLQVLLDGETQTALGELETARQEYDEVLKSIQNTVLLESADQGTNITAHLEAILETLNEPARSMLVTLRLEDGNPVWSGIETENMTAWYDALIGYVRSSDETTSDFEEDLTVWLATIDQEMLDQWSRALSWELFMAAGGQTYDEYYRINPPQTLEYTGNGAPSGTTYLETDVMVERRYRAYVEYMIRDYLLDGYGGAARSGIEDSALNSVFGYLGLSLPPKISVTEHIAALEGAFTGVSGQNGYAFFKFTALTGLLGSGSGTSAHLVYSRFANDFLWDVYEFCRHRGTNAMPFDQPAWHEKRDIVKEKSIGAGLDYSATTDSLVEASRQLVTAAENCAEKEAAYEAVRGSMLSGESGIEALVQALITANDRISGSVLPDVFKTAGMSLSPGEYRQGLLAILRLDGGVSAKEGDDYSKLLSRVLEALDRQCSEAAGELVRYLEATGTDTGIALKQREAVNGYTDAATEFIANGMLPDTIADRNTVLAWETLLRETASGDETGLVLTAASEYLRDAEQQAVDTTVVRQLKKFIQWYTDCREPADTAAAAVGVRDAFSRLVAAYRAGIAYKDSFRQAIEKPVFDSREHIVRDCDFYRGVLADLLTEEATIGSIVFQEVTSRLGDRYLLLEQARQNAVVDVRLQEWNNQMRESEGRFELFTRQIQAIHSRGINEWRNAVSRIQEESIKWQQTFCESFLAKDEAWKSNYSAFLAKEDEWVNELAGQSVHAENTKMLRDLGTSTSLAVTDAADFIVPDVSPQPDIDSLLSTLVNRELLSGLLVSAAEYRSGIAACKPVLFQTFRRGSYNSAAVRDTVRKFHCEQNEEIASRLAYIQYDQAFELLGEAGEHLRQQVEEANRATSEGFRDLFIREGFRESGGKFIKNTTVGATLTDTLKEKHVIDGYRYHEAVLPDLTANLVLPEEMDVGLIGSEGIRALLDHALGMVDEHLKSIFGDDDQISYIREGSNAGTIGKKEYDVYVEALAALSDKDRGKESQTVRYREVRSGSFNEWVGFAPVFKDNADPDRKMEEYTKNVRFAGAGETGRIMGLFIQHKMIEGSGRAESTMPVYNRRLWDDRGSFMEAPTLRSLTDIVCTVTAGIIAPGAGHLILNTALNMIDDAMFTMLDIGHGMDPLEAVESLAKKTAGSYVSGKIGAVFNGVPGVGGNSPVDGLLQKLKLTDDVIGSTLLKGGEIMTTNMATSAINSISVRGILEGGDFFDENSFMEGSFGQSSLAGIAAGMAGYGVTSGLDSMITNSSLAGFSRKYFDGVRDLTGTMGALASAGVTYGLTGNATVNLLSTGMFSDNSSVGLFEVSFGEDGLHGAVGMDGTDLNLGKLVSSLNGASALFENSRIGDYASAHDLHAQVMLRTLYSYGDEAGREIYHDILSDNTKLSMSKNLDGNAEARTVVNDDGTKTVFFRSLSSDVASGVMAGIVLQHEAYRDGLTGSDQEAETFAAVTGHTEMALRIRDDGLYVNVITNNANLTRDIENHKSGTEAFRAYATSYDSSGDYWKVNDKGNLEYDGRANVYDKDGNLVCETKSQGIEGSLLEILGLTDNPTNRKAVVAMMKASGLEQNTNGFWIGTNEAVQRRIPQGGSSYFYIQSGVSLTKLNMGKEISLQSVDSLYSDVHASGKIVKRFMKSTYGSTIGMINSVGDYSDAVNNMLLKAYSDSEIEKIHTNREWLITAVDNGIDLSSLAPGASVTTQFAEELHMLALESSSKPGAKFFSELHTGIDFGGGGESVNTPGGI